MNLNQESHLALLSMFNQVISAPIYEDDATFKRLFDILIIPGTKFQVVKTEDGLRFQWTWPMPNYRRLSIYGSLIYGYASLDQKRDRFRQVCELVAFCHRRDIVLGDICARLFTFDEAQTMLETSLAGSKARSINAKPITLDEMTTPRYASPEIWRHEINHDGKASDIWALGVLLYTMLAELNPFDEPSQYQMDSQDWSAIFDFPKIPWSAKKLIKAMLTYDPKKRPMIENVLNHPYMSWVGVRG